MKPSKAVDTHAHVFSADAPGVPGAPYRPAYAASLGAWQAGWKAAGVARGVVVQVSFFGTDNREVLASIAADPGRLRGVATVDPSFDEAALGALHAAGIRAIRLNLAGMPEPPPLASPEWQSLFVRAKALGLHAEMFADAGRLPEFLPALGSSGIAVALDHFGNPGAGRGALTATLAVAAELAETRPVWVKCSAPYRLGGADPRELLSHWERVLGPDRLVWGSDWPCTRHEPLADYARLRAALDEWADPRRARAILWDNAARLYGF